MKPTETSEKGLETLIVESLINEARYVQDVPAGHPGGGNGSLLKMKWGCDILRIRKSC